jgi:hypothetical protein
MSYVLLYYNALHLDTQPVVKTEIMDLGGWLFVTLKQV